VPSGFIRIPSCNRNVLPVVVLCFLLCEVAAPSDRSAFNVDRVVQEIQLLQLQRQKRMPTHRRQNSAFGCYTRTF
jgi:hypothetical protein